MQRPDLDTLACGNPACHWFRIPGHDPLTVRNVYGQDGMRLLRCRLCGEECSERQGSALFHTKSTATHSSCGPWVARRSLWASTKNLHGAAQCAGRRPRCLWQGASAACLVPMRLQDHGYEWGRAPERDQSLAQAP
jgi:hypothetical protein